MDVAKDFEKELGREFNKTLPKNSSDIGEYMSSLSNLQKSITNEDYDEFFDYPRSKELSLREFLRYLNRHRFTSAPVQMLDMFAETPLQRSTAHLSQFNRKKYSC